MALLYQKKKIKSRLNKMKNIKNVIKIIAVAVIVIVVGYFIFTFGQLGA